jgi:hypothetical protein
MMFFMLPILAPNPSLAKRLFQPLDDLLDTQEDMPSQLRFVLYNESIRPILDARTEAICDVVEAGDEKMFRLNETKLVGELLAKAKRMSSSKKLPASLEERFIRQALQPPLQCVMREDVVTSGNPAPTPGNTEVNGEETENLEHVESQSSATTVSGASVSVSSGVSTPVTVPSTDDLIVSSLPSFENNNISELLRIRVALSFMQQLYLPAHVSTRVNEILASAESPIDFNPLDEQLKHLATLRAEAFAARSASNYTRKRANLDEEGEVQEGRAEKKQRLEEEEKKKKAGQSRGVRDLKKVNTSGMKKMSDFFSKAAAKKKG